MSFDLAFESSQQSFESLTLSGNGKHRLSSNFDEFGDLTQQDFADEDEVSLLIRDDTNIAFPFLYYMTLTSLGFIL